MYTGIGALCWLPDVRRWAEVVSALLRPGGRLLLTDLVAAETVYVLGSFYEAPRHQVAEAVRSLIAFEADSIPDSPASSRMTAASAVSPS